MRLERGSIAGIDFYHRPGYSDLKTFKEVLGRRVYQARGMTIEPGESWMDCGGNVGAFALLACSRGATVTTYEPDPYSARMIRRNLELNGFKAKIVQAALVHDDTPEVTLHIGNNNNAWRSSIVKRWNELGLRVPALNFDQEAQGHDCCKMDIEGAEMPILESTRATFAKLVYEWSFDIDPSLTRLWSLIDAQKEAYRVEAAYSTIRYHKKDQEQWLDSWFPACTNVFCFQP